MISPVYILSSRHGEKSLYKKGHLIDALSNVIAYFLAESRSGQEQARPTRLKETPIFLPKDREPTPPACN